MRKLSQKNGSLDLVDAGIVSLEIVDIFLMTTVIAKGTDDISELRIVSGDSTRIAESAKVLARIEAVTSSIAKSTSLAVAKGTSMSLSIVLNEFQTILATSQLWHKQPTVPSGMVRVTMVSSTITVHCPV